MTNDRDSIDDLKRAARAALDASILRYEGRPVGTVAARDDGVDALNYGECFTRDFAVSAVAMLLEGRYDIVRNFLTVLAELQSRDRHMDCFRPSAGLMPASFGVIDGEGGQALHPDFGERAIARVAPVDAVLWWLVLLRAYTRASGDETFARSPQMVTAIERILDLCLIAKFEMFPTLLVPDGAYMIDRRMGVYGRPIDVQALFVASLRSAYELLPPAHPTRPAVLERLGHLIFHLRTYYWLDLGTLNEIYRYRTEQFGADVMNRFNIYPDAIPDWVKDWMPYEGGYFAGNLGPARMDFRFFAQGNLIAILTSLATEAQSTAIMGLIEQRWDDLVGRMPMKVCFPALEGRDWQVVTGSDPKNVPWSYHNGGSWPFLLWMLVAAAHKVGRDDLAQRAIDVAAVRIGRDGWVEYYDGRSGQLIGKEARRHQTWTIAGFLAAVSMVDGRRSSARKILEFEEAPEVVACTLEAEEAKT